MKLIACLLLTLAASSFVSAQPAQRVRVTIETEPINSTREIRILLTFSIAPGWYTYWKNPGDSGLPIEIVWSIPDGWTVGDLRFPVPEKIVYDESVVYGYRKDFTLMTSMTLPDGMAGDASSLSLHADLDLMGCMDVCLREKSSLAFSIPLSDAKRKKSFERRWKKAASSLPRPWAEAGIELKDLRISQEGSTSTMTLTFKEKIPGGISDFYPEVIENAVPELGSIIADGGRVTIRIAPEDAHKPVGAVTGLLIRRGQAYECHFSSSRIHD